MSDPGNIRLDQVLEHPAPALTTDDAARLLAEHFAIVGRLSALASERDQNFHVATRDAGEFVLKIANGAEQQAVPALQNAALAHIATVAPDLPVPRVRTTIAGEALLQIRHQCDSHYVRLLDYLPGRTLETLPRTAAPRAAMSALLARLGRALRGFFHPGAGRELLWDIKHAARLRVLLPLVDDHSHRDLATAVFANFSDNVLPRLRGLRAQVIHGDLNPDNVLVDTADPNVIRGVIDFGDIVHAPLVCDLAIATAYQLFEAADPAGVICEMAASYHDEEPLREDELALLPALIAVRLATTGTIASWRVSQHPGNRAYIVGHQALAWDALERLTALAPSRLTRALHAACGVPAARPGSDSSEIPVDDASLAARRREVLGPTLRLFYDRPLQLVRGCGVHVYDAAGREYLDAYNNVVSVGHGQADVVAAISRQARRLNTHTRYLHPAIVDYAERLVALLPEPLSVCMFVCSGSEANDLALQIARWITGRQGVVVTGHAYHGTTAVVRELSTEDVPSEQRADWVATTVAPNCYSGQFRGTDEETADACVRDFSASIRALEERGHGLAGVFVDSLYSSEGVLVPPPGYLSRIFERCREAGALCVADEVQAGFARSGTDFWGFQAHGVIPDIVTLGKPMGNGHPVAAVVTTAEIASRFARRGSYFNTCAGNPVSCAAGMAVLDVIERDDLQRHCRETGRYLKTGLTALSGEHAIIGDVRGTGLFLGIELVLDRDTREPAGGHANRIVNDMRERGVLIGRTGPGGNVLKIRPPLVFARSHADRLLDQLASCLDGVGL